MSQLHCRMIFPSRIAVVASALLCFTSLGMAQQGGQCSSGGPGGGGMGNRGMGQMSPGGGAQGAGNIQQMMQLMNAAQQMQQIQQAQQQAQAQYQQQMRMQQLQRLESQSREKQISPEHQKLIDQRAADFQQRKNAYLERKRLRSQKRRNALQGQGNPADSPADSIVPVPLSQQPFQNLVMRLESPQSTQLEQ